MNLNYWLPLLAIASSFIPGIMIFFLREESRTLRTVLNIAGAVLKIVVVGIMLWGAARHESYETKFPLVTGLNLHLRADALSLLFASLSAILWLLTTIYAIGYLEHSQNRSRFFGFFSLCVTSTVGVALAANLITFFIFYELLTITTYPLVVHRGNRKSMKAGAVYLLYTLGGSTVLLLGIVWLRNLLGPIEFRDGGCLQNLTPAQFWQAKSIFLLLICGLGVKSALVPLHGWLPEAMVAPAPVSALLHAVAVVKAGAFGIVRVVYSVFGIELCAQLSVLAILAVLASLTIIYGSVQALYQREVKRLLAFSTVSQVSYILLGTAIFGPLSTTGGIVHLVHQGVMKITLFFCAGNLAEELDIHKIDQMKGVGRRMPVTMTAFTLGALGMIGVPPLAGFFSKWYIGLGAVAVDQSWVILILAASTMLNAAYFLPLIYTAWFQAPETSWGGRESRFLEISPSLLIPPVLTALLSLAFGLFANAPISPLSWAIFITGLEYGR